MNIEEYNKLKSSKMSRIAIANHFGVTENQIKSFIRKHGLGTKRPTITNENCFSVFTEESCYWAGFLAADGCITGGTVKLCLGHDDHNQVEKFRDFIGSSHSITVNTEKYYRSEISFKNSRIVEDLTNKFNITPNKSMTYCMPENIPHNMLRHFIRGYFDGDGCICESFSNKNSTTATLYTTITGSKSLVEYLHYKLKLVLDISGTVQDKPGCSVVKYCTNKSKVLLDFMYEDASVFLDRKYNLYNQIKLFRKIR